MVQIRGNSCERTGIVLRTNKLIVCDLVRIKLDPECLGMIGVSGANLTIGRVLDIGVSTSVPDRSLEDALIFLDGPVLQEDVFDAPEAAGGESGDLRSGNGGRHFASILLYVWFTKKGDEREETGKGRHGTYGCPCRPMS
jgi:hypothetical protein